MISEEMKYKMYGEAWERMNVLELNYEDKEALVDRRMKKICVDHKNHRIIREELTADEKAMIKKIEKERDFLIYYCIKDEGYWPDGATFERYTLPYIDTFEDDYPAVIEECIGQCRTLPAYVVNMEEPEYSEVTEFAFEVIKGLMINVS